MASAEAVDGVHGEVQDIGNKIQNGMQGIGSVVKDISGEVRGVNCA
jgi:hypothetical protein